MVLCLPKEYTQSRQNKCPKSPLNQRQHVYLQWKPNKSCSLSVSSHFSDPQFSRYRSMKLSRNDLPFRKAPATKYVLEKRLNLMAPALSITCNRYNANWFVLNIIFVENLIERFFIKNEIVFFTFIINFDHLYRSVTGSRHWHLF